MFQTPMKCEKSAAALNCIGPLTERITSASLLRLHLGAFIMSNLSAVKNKLWKFNKRPGDFVPLSQSRPNSM